MEIQSLNRLFRDTSIAETERIQEYKRRLESTIFKEGGGGGHYLYITEVPDGEGNHDQISFMAITRNCGRSYLDNETPHKLLNSTSIS